MKKRKTLTIVLIALGAVILAGAAAWKYHEMPQFCATCHVMKPYLVSWQNSAKLAHAHAVDGVTCLECHEPKLEQQIDEAKKYITGNYDNPPKERDFGNEWCLRCHEHGSVEQIIERTKDYTVEGQKVNPHAAHAGLTDVEQVELECSECHKMHKDSPGLLTCYGCHHMGTFQTCVNLACHASGIPGSE